MKAPAVITTDEDRSPRRGVADQKLHAHCGTAFPGWTPHRAMARTVHAVRLALLHTHRTQLLMLRQQAAADATPAALARCDAQLALVQADISALSWRRP
jgi:hypothetical protein